MTPNRLALVAVLAVLGGCRGSRLSSPEVGLVVEPPSLSFPTSYVGYPATATVSVRNTSRVPLRADVGSASPFSVPDFLDVPAGTAVSLEVQFSAEAEGEATGTLSLGWSGGSVDVALDARALQPADCPKPSDCHTARFDPARGTCVEEAVADGIGCADNRCVTAGTCLGGICVGGPVACGDDNACTLDSCDPVAGCRHDDTSAQCPKPADPCHVALCAPATGCGVALAADGTPCGPNDCHTAQVCMAGICETKVPPEGSACAPTTLCRAEGTCRGLTCVLPEPTALAPAWTYRSAAGRQLRFGGHIDPDGNVYFIEGDSTVTELVSLDADGRGRFRVELMRQCSSCQYYSNFALDPPAGRLLLAVGRRAQARSLTDGHLLWDQDLTQGLAIYNPTPDGGGSFYHAAPVLLGANLVGFQMSEGYTDHHAYVTAVDRSTGVTSWQVHKKGHLYGPGATALGELWLSSANCWAPAGDLVRVSTAGTQQAGRFLAAIPGAYGANEAWVTSYSETMVISPALADTKLTLPAGQHAASQSALLSNGRVVFVTADASNLRSLVEVDSVTLLPRWSVPLGPLAGTPDLELTTDGGVLAVGFGLATAKSDGGAFVLALGQSGAEQLRCPLPASPTSPLAVRRGLYMAQLSSDLLSAYDLPGYDVEPTGWVAQNGNLERSRSAR